MLEKFKKTVDWYNNLTGKGQKIAIQFAILLAIGFAGYQGYNYVSNLRELNKKYIDEKFESQNLKMAALQLQVKDCMNKDTIIANQAQEISDLKTALIVLKAASDKFPFPYWIKSEKGKMLFLNKAYYNKYLKHRGLKISDYIGEYDYDIWDKEIAESFRKNDGLIISANRPLTFIEVVNGEKLHVTKFPMYLEDYLYGIAGVEYLDFK